MWNATHPWWLGVRVSNSGGRGGGLRGLHSGRILALSSISLLLGRHFTLIRARTGMPGFSIMWQMHPEVTNFVEMDVQFIQSNGEYKIAYICQKFNPVCYEIELVQITI